MTRIKRRFSTKNEGGEHDTRPTASQNNESAKISESGAWNMRVEERSRNLVAEERTQP